MKVKRCKQCGKPLPRDGRYSQRIFCPGEECRKAFTKKPETSFRNDSDKGAASEIMIAADLLRRGFSVYRSCSPSAPFDLAIYKDETLLRVEVKTGRIHHDILSYSQPSNSEYDILSVYILETQEIQYIPPFE